MTYVEKEIIYLVLNDTTMYNQCTFNTWQSFVKWLSKPQGAPSGVWTGHIKPQASGSSCLASVVLISWKKEPLCTALKWDMYRILFMFSATIVRPLSCSKPNPELLFTFPVAKKLFNDCSTSPAFLTAKFSSSASKENLLDLNHKEHFVLYLFKSSTRGCQFHEKKKKKNDFPQSLY